MRTKVLVTLALLAIAIAPASAQIGLGFTVGYPVGYAFYYEYNYGGLPDPAPLFWGATVKWKPSSFMLDSGIGIWRIESLTVLYGYLDLGVALDLWIFRWGLSGGMDVVTFSEPGYPSASGIGINAKTSLDLKLGPVTVGAAFAVPLDIIVSVLQQEEGGVFAGDNFLRIFAGHASLSVVYWFGSAKKPE